MIFLKNEDVILFQGDSITHGGRGSSQEDKNHIIGHGYQSILAGRLAFENIARCPEIINRGVSGDTTEDLLKRWSKDTLELKPTVLSILIGVNNCLFPSAGADRKFYTELCELLRLTKERIPDVKLIICEPFSFSPTVFSSEAEKEFVRKRTELVRSCAAHSKIAADSYGAVFVPFWQELEKYAYSCPEGKIIWDGIHPTYLGHEIMARFWYKTVEESGILPSE